MDFNTFTKYVCRGYNSHDSTKLEIIKLNPKQYVKRITNTTLLLPRQTNQYRMIVKCGGVQLSLIQRKIITYL